MRHFSRLLVGFLSGIAGALVVAGLFLLTSWARETEPAIKVETTPVNRDAKLGASFAPVVKKAAPSVVNIYSTHIVHIRPMRNPFFADPFFRQFFGDQFPDDGRGRTRREQSLGSGVIISPDGYILTANHVVDGADEIEVAIADNKKEFTARVIGTDPPTDVAVLKIDAKDLPAITLGDSDQLEVGDIVLAIGNPFRVGQTVTMGIVSALGRGNLPSAASTSTRISFKPTRPSIPAIPAARWWTPKAGSWASIPPLFQQITAAIRALVLPCPSTWRAGSWNASSPAAK